MAKQEIQTVLVGIVPVEKARTPTSVFGDSQVGPNHGCRQSYLGNATHPWGVVETRLRDFRADGVAIDRLEIGTARKRG